MMVPWWWIPVSWVVLIGFIFAILGFAVVFLGFRAKLKERRTNLTSGHVPHTHIPLKVVTEDNLET